MSDKIWAYHPGGVVSEIISLDDRLTPGKDMYVSEMADDMTDVTNRSPAPDLRWTTNDGGKTFLPPAMPKSNASSTSK